MEDRGNQNQEQFLRLLMLNDRRIYAYILSIVPNINDADDIMQETSAVMWRKFGNFDSGMDFSTWALTIARYQILSYLKKRKRSKVRFNSNLVKSIEEEVKRVIPDLDERLTVLKNCIHKLGYENQNILKLRYEKGYTFENIGAHISKSTRAAFYTLSRIHQLLQRCVKRTFSEAEL